MLERSAADLDLPALVESTQDLHPREAARVLIEHVVRAHDGRLHDDATVMCPDWYGTGFTRRDAGHGAGVSEASPTVGRHTSLPPLSPQASKLKVPGRTHPPVTEHAPSAMTDSTRRQPTRLPSDQAA
ncbi:hypothetical protein ACH4MM_01360 [Streptomyces pratensis]|uniref:hypothetical protein n=1 Tax=Streptomyces pratensis TaxID=1169025 RepID=UPI0037A9E9AF